ncbi:unnamed protein product [Arabidopsis halleri]
MLLLHGFVRFKNHGSLFKLLLHGFLFVLSSFVVHNRLVREDGPQTSTRKGDGDNRRQEPFV